MISPHVFRGCNPGPMHLKLVRHFKMDIRGLSHPKFAIVRPHRVLCMKVLAMNSKGTVRNVLALIGALAAPTILAHHGAQTCVRGFLHLTRQQLSPSLSSIADITATSCILAVSLLTPIAAIAVSITQMLAKHHVARHNLLTSSCISLGFSLALLVTFGWKERLTWPQMLLIRLLLLLVMNTLTPASVLLVPFVILSAVGESSLQTKKLT